MYCSRKAESLPDPYNSMSLEMKRFVDGIADMGFSRARVARTAQKLGQDDKKVRKSFFFGSVPKKFRLWQSI